MEEPLNERRARSAAERRLLGAVRANGGRKTFLTDATAPADLAALGGLEWAGALACAARTPATVTYALPGAGGGPVGDTAARAASGTQTFRTGSPSRQTGL